MCIYLYTHVRKCLCMHIPLSIYSCKGLPAPMDMTNLCIYTLFSHLFRICDYISYDTLYFATIYICAHVPFKLVDLDLGKPKATSHPELNKNVALPENKAPPSFQGVSSSSRFNNCPFRCHYPSPSSRSCRSCSSSTSS